MNIIRLKLLFFGKSRDLAGENETILELNRNDILDGFKLIELIVRKYPRYSNYCCCCAKKQKI